jgi:hypothetical protein
MKYFTLIVLFVLFSCGNKEDILLPKSGVTVVSDVQDHSPIYIFFRTKDKDTMAEVNRKNSIISTNWILNIDKRLPLRLVIPEVIKLQQKKREEKAHKNEKAENYYSYADTIGKNLAFIPFTNVYYKMEKPMGTIIFFNKNNEILIENTIVKKEKVKEVLIQILSKEQSNNFTFSFNKDLSFGSYLQNKIFIESLKLEMKSNQEFIY